MKTQNTLATLVVVTLAGTGCGEQFDPASLIAGTRVLGAQVTVDGDATRSTPAPGETVTVDWLVVAPAAVPPLGWAFVVCTGPQTCVPLAQGNDLPMRFVWTVPVDGSVGATVQMLGQVCEHGTVTWTGAQPGCSDGARGTLVSQDIIIAQAGVTNRIPDLAARPLSFDGAAWNAGTACEALPVVALGSKDHQLVLTTLAEDRETFQTVDGDPPAPVSKVETLQVSNFTTAGELDRSFSYIESSVTDAATPVTVAWDAPDTMPATGPMVPFIFVVRDGRGGLAQVTRAVCLY